MVRVGILGSVGSGKTFVANIFKELSFNIFSADNEVANIYKNNKLINLYYSDLYVNNNIIDICILF